MARPITPTTKLNVKETVTFLRSVNRNATKPIGLVPTPKLHEIIKTIKERTVCKESR